MESQIQFGQKKFADILHQLKVCPGWCFIILLDENDPNSLAYMLGFTLGQMEELSLREFDVGDAVPITKTR